jgi:transposase
MRRHDYDLFLKLVNSDLLDLKRKKDEILRFYYANKAIITPTGNLSKLIEEDKLQKKSKRDKNYWIRLKKKKEEEKIKRLRKKDKKRQEEIQKKLEEELLRKKEAIRKEQLKELQNTY